ncbi:MAG TPA: hypothetical protein VEA18_00900, partial [Candidatus Kapabacteria bacterium]|nr:hypothetical protein [Candidatus Kapabacteria bacterium]
MQYMKRTYRWLGAVATLLMVSMVVGQSASAATATITPEQLLGSMFQRLNEVRSVGYTGTIQSTMTVAKP